MYNNIIVLGYSVILNFTKLSSKRAQEPPLLLCQQTLEALNFNFFTEQLLSKVCYGHKSYPTRDELVVKKLFIIYTIIMSKMRIAYIQRH